MVLKEFHCTRCDHAFTEEVFEKAELEEIQFRVPSSQIHCPKCHSTHIEQGRILKYLGRRRTA